MLLHGPRRKPLPWGEALLLLCLMAFFLTLRGISSSPAYELMANFRASQKLQFWRTAPYLPAEDDWIAARLATGDGRESPVRAAASARGLHLKFHTRNKASFLLAAEDPEFATAEALLRGLSSARREAGKRVELSLNGKTLGRFRLIPEADEETWTEALNLPRGRFWRLRSEHTAEDCHPVTPPWSICGNSETEAAEMGRPRLTGAAGLGRLLAETYLAMLVAPSLTAEIVLYEDTKGAMRGIQMTLTKNARPAPIPPLLKLLSKQEAEGFRSILRAATTEKIRLAFNQLDHPLLSAEQYLERKNHADRELFP